jgi:hemolysin type calcium binding protein/hemolysin type calcium-binding protein
VDTERVTALADGGHLVVWGGANGTADPNGWGVYGQRYDASGAPVGGNFLVNTTTADNQLWPHAAGLSNHGFVVTWSSYNQDGGWWGNYGQVYNSDGSKPGGEFLINQTTQSDQLYSAVTALANGGFAVTWMSTQNQNNSWDVYARLFNANGSAASNEFLVNQYTSGSQETDAWVTEDIAGLNNGKFVVTWTDWNGEDGSGTGTYGRIFNANGSAATNEFLVNTSTLGSQYYSSVGALQDGGFVVVWLNDSGTRGIYAQRYDASGARVGTEVLVSSFSNGNQVYPKVSALSDGGYVVAWQSYGDNNTNAWQIAGQRYAADGSAVNGEFIINSATFAQHEFPSIALRADGALVATWRNDNNNSIEEKIITSFNGEEAPKNLLGGPGNDVFVGSNGNDTLNGGGGNDNLIGNGGSDVYQFDRGGGHSTIVNGLLSNRGPTSELDFGQNIARDQLWFEQNGNDLTIDIMGSNDQVTIQGWYGDNTAQLQEIKTADGSMLDAGLSQLVQAMATFEASNPGFDPTASGVTQAPNDQSLQNAIAAAWHP